MYNLPIIRTVADLEREFPDTIIISKYDTYEKYDQLYYKLYYAICACFEIKECVGYQMPFKFYQDDDVTHSLSLPKLLLNLNPWRSLIELNSVDHLRLNDFRVLDESFIIGTMMSATLRRGLDSKILKVLTDNGISFDRVSELLKIVIERYQEISIEFSLVSNESVMTLESTFLNDYRSSAKIRELNNLVIPQTMQTSDVEKLLREKTSELVAELGVTKNPLFYISTAGDHLKPKQIQELFLSYGQIPDVSGNVIPYTMKGNGFSTGYNDPGSFFIAAQGARLSSIMNKVHMGEAGYLSRNLILASRTLTLSNTMYDCGTKHLLPVYVRDSTFLHRLENKWFTEHLGQGLELCVYEKHRNLIGKHIWIRSLVTCAGGDECCHMCYGKDSHLVANMPGMAIFNTEVFSEPVSQNILSTKHLLFTSANKISFNDDFHNYFVFNSGDVYGKDIEEWESVELVDQYSIRIEEHRMVPVNRNDMAEYNTFGNTVESPFYVYNKVTKEYIAINITNVEAMFIDSASMQCFTLVECPDTNKIYYDMKFSVLYNEFEGRLLSIDIKNNGLTDNLYMIMNLLNKDANKYNSYSELAQYFFEMLIAAGIKCRHVQAEIIINRLLRDAVDKYSRPDFSQFKHPEFQIMNLNQVLINSRAPTIGLSYQEVKRQILNNAIYDEKHGKSYLDPLYANRISTKPLRRLLEQSKAKRDAKLKQQGGN